MSEKRFTIDIDDENFAHILDNNTDIGQYNLCRLLNELHEENKHLQGKTSSWKRTASKEISEKQKLVKRIVKLEKENKELQQELFESECAYIHERYYHKSEIEEEIEELKIEFKARFGRDFE